MFLITGSDCRFLIAGLFACQSALALDTDGLQLDHESDQPTIAASCFADKVITLSGISVSEQGQLELADGDSDFHFQCENIRLTGNAGDIVLSASCVNNDADLVETALSLIDAPALQPMLTHPACQAQTVTTVNSETVQGNSSPDIGVQLTDIDCKPVDEGSGAVVDLTRELSRLEGVPFLALYCAIHEQGQTWLSFGGFTADQARANAEAECEALARQGVAEKGAVTSPCELWGIARRELNLGGSIGGSVIRTHRTPIELELVTPDKKPQEVSLKLPKGRPPQITAACLQGRMLPLHGISINDQGELIFRDGYSDFQQHCDNINLIDSEDDALLSARCTSASGTQVDASISLLGSAALEDMLSYQSCVDEPLMCTADGPNPLLFPPETLELAMTQFADDGLAIDFPNTGEFLLLRSADEQVIVLGRRDRWTHDLSQSVFTALFMYVGEDIVEIYAAPEGAMLVNGVQPEPADELVLSGGGLLEIADQQTLQVYWPDSSFMAEVRVFPGSHLVPAFKPDPNMTYEGLVRFTERWIVDDGESPFNAPLTKMQACNCGDGSAGAQVVACGLLDPSAMSDQTELMPIRSGQQIAAGVRYQSQQHPLDLIYRADGYVAIESRDGSEVIWSSAAYNIPPAPDGSLELSLEGALLLRDADGNTVWDAAGDLSSPGSVLYIDDTYELLLLSPQWSRTPVADLSSCVAR